MNLSELREEIDGIDRAWISLLSRRLEVARRIACIKREQEQPIFDAKREAAMQEEIRRLARMMRLDPGFAENLLLQVIDYTKAEMAKGATL